MQEFALRTTKYKQFPVLILSWLFVFFLGSEAERLLYSDDGNSHDLL